MYSGEKIFYVLVPVYNVETYLYDCIQSVLNQTYQEFRLILVDDGSTDCSGSICDACAERDERIYVIHQENKGLMMARQTAVKYVLQQSNLKNAYIVYLDSDDALKPYALETIFGIFQEKDCDMVIYGSERVCNGKIVRPFDVRHAYIGTVTDKRELYKIVFMTSIYNGLCRKAISGNLLTDEIYGNVSHIRRGEDLVRSISYYEKCKKAVFIRDVLYEYTDNPKSIINSTSFETYEKDSTVQRLVWDFIQKQNVWNKQDYEDYFRYLRKMMRNSISRIARFDVDMEKKTELFNQMKADEYYRMVLASVTPKDRWMNLLINSQYRKLCWEIQMRAVLVSLYHKLRGR